jgi:hypothetical protein
VVLTVLAVLFLHAQQEGRVLRLVALVEKVWLPWHLLSCSKTVGAPCWKHLRVCSPVKP